MTQENKELLLKDLCARLPYSVKYFDTLNPKEQPSTLESIDACGLVMNTNGDSHYMEYIKPYLFPMSSMTEEQIQEFEDINRNIYNFFKNADGNSIEKHQKSVIELQRMRCDWLNANHFDYRGLIEKGLAIDATGQNIY